LPRATASPKYFLRLPSFENFKPFFELEICVVLHLVEVALECEPEFLQPQRSILYVPQFVNIDFRQRRSDQGHILRIFQLGGGLIRLGEQEQSGLERGAGHANL